MSKSSEASATGFDGLFKRLQIWSGKRRLRLARDSSHARTARVDGFGGDEAYCERLLQVYDEMREAPNADPPRRSTLLSHVPEWTYSLQHKDAISDQGFHLKEVRRIPRLQAALANCTSYTPSKWLLEQELAVRYSNDAMKAIEHGSPKDAEGLIERYEELRGKETSWPRTGEAAPGVSEAEAKDVYYAAAEEKLAGLCLSGGGIRSATFCLGILQTLAEHDLIGEFDYISSVSGGGYIHEWMAAWLHREPRGLASVEEKMKPLPTAGSLARAPEQINWLRRYSSYLTPQRGMFTADTWTLVAIWFRNTFLNQIVLFSFFAVGLVLARTAMLPFTMGAYGPAATGSGAGDEWQWGFLAAAVICLVWGLWGVRSFWRALGSVTADLPERGTVPPDGAMGNFAVVGMIVVPGFLLSVLAALASDGMFRLRDVAGGSFAEAQAFWSRYGHGVPLMLVAWAVYVLALAVAETFGGRAMESARNNNRWGYGWLRGVGFVLSIALCAGLPVGVAMYVSVHGYGGATIQEASGDAAHRLHQILVALIVPVLFFAAQFMAIRLNLGLLGRSYEESRREWLARYGAWAAIVSFLWLGVGAIALLGPNLYYWIFDSGHTRKLMGAAAVVLIHAATLYSGSSSKTSGTPDPQKFFGYSLFDLVGIVGAPIAILSLLLIASGLVDIGTNDAWNFYGSVVVPSPLLHGMQLGAAHDSSLHWLRELLRCQLWGPVFLFIAYVKLLLLFGWRVDVNEFSMHPFYRDRLSRCYIGASNGHRVPDPFTGFDDHSEASTRSGIALADLLPARFGGQPRPKRPPNDGPMPPYDGPMPIFCSTVNLTFGEDLAFQDRKGASFAFTPMYSGYYVGWTAEQGDGEGTTTYNGFVPTREYAYRGQASGSGSGSGVPLATVTAISGAALSPNQGFSSQPAVAFLMTLFNARLGWWIANPRKPWIWPNEMDQPTPRFGLRYLLSELFGHADDTSNYVSLCDGGRFDNMGLYELVRRRCSLIVVCDGEEDENTTFEGMGLAIAKARIDFGVEIDFPKEAIEALTPDEKTKCSKEHFACGTIRYPAPPGGDSMNDHYLGKIVYLKTAYVGDEPIDLRHYKREHPAFPQESTLNQWFTEPQFESYRRLGQLTAEGAVGHMNLRHG
jgi:hypothetical protein